MIYTIGRQVGSGGRIVGKMLAERLGLPFYDRKILSLASEHSGIQGQFFEKADEREAPGNALGGLGTWLFGEGHLLGGMALGAQSCLSSHALFQAQSEAIHQAAAAGGGVFVGRCADYVLRDLSPRLDVFVTADLAARIARVEEYQSCDASSAAKFIAEAEAKRAEYYNFFTEKTWGRADSYQLCLDTTHMTLEAACEIILRYAESQGVV